MNSVSYIWLFFTKLWNRIKFEANYCAKVNHCMKSWYFMRPIFLVHILGSSSKSGEFNLVLKFQAAAFIVLQEIFLMQFSVVMRACSNQWFQQDVVNLKTSHCFCSKVPLYKMKCHLFLVIAPLGFYYRKLVKISLLTLLLYWGWCRSYLSKFQIGDLLVKNQK